MTQNNIAKLRKAKGVTLERLSELTGLDTSFISRMQNEERPLSVENAEKIGAALGVTKEAVLGFERAEDVPSHFRGGFAEDELVAYDAGPSDPFKALEVGNRALLEVRCNSVDNLHIRKGDLVLVDYSAEICANPPPLAAVRVQFHPDDNRFGHAVTLLRQFVPPNLVITNCSGPQALPIDLSSQDAHILGVVIRSLRKHV